MTVKITSLQAENVKRIKAVQLEPSQDGLTIIGGRNNQGKTSVLDAIAWALGGNRMRPTEPHRAGSVQDPAIRIELSNGLIVERKGKNSDLKVTDPTGKKSGQAILDALIGEMALNVPKFMEMSSKDKARKMLEIVGVKDELAELDAEKEKLAAERLFAGRHARANEESFKSMEHYPEAGTDLWSAAELISQQQEIMAKNASNAQKRSQVDKLESQLSLINEKIQSLEDQLKELTSQKMQVVSDLEMGKKDVMELYDESTAELEANIASVELHNEQVRANKRYEKAKQGVENIRIYYKELNVQMRELEEKRMNLLQGANLPLPDLSVNEAGELIYKGQPWGNMSSSEQLKVSAAICQRMNPECGFVLMDKLEQMDSETMAEFGQWLESNGLQVIATRVSTGDECSIIIEDGKVKGDKEDDKGPDQNSNLGAAWSW